MIVARPDARIRLVSPSNSLAKMAHFSSNARERPQPDEEEDFPPKIQVSFSEPSIDPAPSNESADHTDLFRDARITGNRLREAGNYSQALHYYGVALHAKVKKLRFEKPDIQAMFADILFDVGTIHLVPEHLDKGRALDSLEYCLDLRRVCLGPDHHKVATVLYKLASVHSSFGDNLGSLDMLLEALSILLISQPESTTTLVELWAAIGKVHQALGHFDEAQSSFEEAALLKRRDCL